MTTESYSPYLAAAYDAWLAASDLRSRRERYKRYTYGDQWSDIVEDRNGFAVKESELLKQRGCKPLTNNMIRQLVKTVIGKYRATAADSATYRADSPGLEYIAENSLLELDCRMLEEFLISGCAIQRVNRETRRGVYRLWIDNVDPRSFFVNSFRDPRGSDIELIGMAHDLTFPEILGRLAGRNIRKAAFLANVYGVSAGDRFISAGKTIGATDTAFDDFLTAPPGKCRAFEVWSLEYRKNRVRDDNNFYDKSEDFNFNYEWRCRWFAPDGTMLCSFPSTYAHGSHPFALKFYPLTDGEIHSFVEDVIDQQRCINRMAVLIDHIIGSSAKGVLLFPYNQKPKQVDWEDIAEAWARTDGVIPITGMGPLLPTQVMTPTKDIGAYQLLSLQMKLFNNISGVSDVTAGRDIPASTGEAVYESQLRNSEIALADIIDTFADFRALRDFKAQNSHKQRPRPHVGTQSIASAPE